MNAQLKAPAAAPLFYWNGVKDAKGAKLQRCHYSETGGSGSKFPAGTMTIYARDYKRFSALVRDCFIVENGSDSQIDYFEQDRIRVIPSHPLHAQVRAAYAAYAQHEMKRHAKRAGGCP